MMRAVMRNGGGRGNWYVVDANGRTVARYFVSRAAAEAWIAEEGR